MAKKGRKRETETRTSGLVNNLPIWCDKKKPSVRKAFQTNRKIYLG